MTIHITHAFVSAIADGADATVVRPSNWNADLVTSMATGKLLGRSTAAAGAFEELTVGTGLTLSGGTLSASGSSTWDTIGAAAGSATTANGANNIVYQTAPTADFKIAWRFTESAAATNGTSTSGVPNQVLLRVDTVAASTQSPLSVYSRGSHVFSVSPSTAQVLATNGTASVPAYSFAASTNSGMFLTATDLNITYNGTVALLIRATRMYSLDGTAGAPALSSSSGGNSGIFWDGSQQLAISTGTVLNTTFIPGGQLLAGVLFSALGTPSDGALKYCSDCTAASVVDQTCAGSGSGSMAARVNGAWKCFT